MKLDTFTYSAASGWSAEPLGDLDSESTLVLVFGSPMTLTTIRESAAAA
jgi:hypothetical protein